jgi:hypothetical protein
MGAIFSLLLIAVAFFLGLLLGRAQRGDEKAEQWLGFVRGTFRTSMFAIGVILFVFVLIRLIAAS